MTELPDGSFAALIAAIADDPDTHAQILDPICGDENDDEVCDLDPGHDGDHCSNLSVSWPTA